MGNEVCSQNEDLTCCITDNSYNQFRRKNFEEQKPKNKFYINSYKIIEDYIILHPAIGKGSYGSVYRAINRSTNIMRAVKRISKVAKSMQ